MNKLTKEECLEAVKGLRLLERAENFEKGKNIAPQTKCDVIRQLINEHFELKEIIKKHGLENLTLHELDCAFKKMLGYVQENNRLMNLLTQQNEIIKEYQNGEAYKVLKESYDELLANAVKLQEGICTCCEHSNPPLKFEELEVGMWIWNNKIKEYLKVYDLEPTNKRIWLGTICYMNFEENRFYRKEVKHD